MSRPTLNKRCWLAFLLLNHANNRFDTAYSPSFMHKLNTDGGTMYLFKAAQEGRVWAGYHQTARVPSNLGFGDHRSIMDK